MDEPTLEDIREAKAELIRRLNGHADFAGAGMPALDKMTGALSSG